MASVHRNRRTGRIEVRAYAGIDPVTHRPRNLSASLPGDAPGEAIEEAKRRLDARAGFCKGSGYPFTLGGGLRYYLDSLAAIGRSPTTIDAYESKYRCYVEPFIADVPLDKAMPYIFSSLYSRLLAEGGKDGNPVGRNTVRQFHAFLSGAFKWLCDVPLIAHNPLDGVTQPSEEFHEAAPLTEQAFASLMDYLGTHHGPFDDAVWLFLHSGARRGEVAAMRGKYLRSSSMRIMQTLVQSKSAGRALLYKQPKGNKARTVDLDEGTYGRMLRHFERQGLMLAQAGIRQGGDTPLFAREDGSPYPPSWYTDSFRKLADSLGMGRGVHLHTLRHTHATYLIEECDVSLNEIQARFGHCNISVTLKNYGHLLPGSGAEAARQFARLADTKKGML